MTLADLWAVALMGTAAWFLWWLAERMAEPQDKAFLRRVVLATFALRAAWAFTQHNIIPQYYWVFGADTRGGYANAVRLARLWHEGLWTPRLPTGLAETHSLASGLKTITLLYLFGPSPMLAEAFTITANVSICIAVYLICRHIRATRLATRAAVVFNAFLPSLIFWSTQDLRDPVTATCITWAILAMLKVSQKLTSPYYLLLLAADFLAVAYRPYVGILLIVGQGLAWAYAVKLPRTPVGTIARVGLFLILAPLALQFGVAEMKATYGEQMGLQWAVESFQAFRESGIRGGLGGSEYVIPITASTPAQAILQLPIRILLLLLSPIPIFPGTFRRILAYPEMWFIYLYLIPRFARGVREAWRKNRLALMTILLAVAPIIAAYAIKTAVSGEAIRMRTQFLPVLLILAGVGHAVKERASASVDERRPVPSHSGRGD